MQKLKLYYFNRPGRTEPIRLILHFGGIPFQDIRLTKEQFQEEKQKGTFPNDQVPVLELEGKKYAQSEALIRYAAHQAKLYPKDSLDVLKIENTIFNFLEIFDRVTITSQIEDENKKLEAQNETATVIVPKWLQRIEDILVQNGSNGYITGSEITYGDLVLFSRLSVLQSGVIKHIPADIFTKYPSIIKAFNIVESHPKIQEYYSRK